MDVMNFALIWIVVNFGNLVFVRRPFINLLPKPLVAAAAETEAATIAAFTDILKAVILYLIRYSKNIFHNIQNQTR